MTTTIVPGAGDGVLLTQQGVGTSPGYSALDIRRLHTGALQEGIYGTSTTVAAGGVSSVVAADFMVTQRASGANLSVDINMPGGGMAFVQGDTIAGQGLYGVPVAAANINEAIASADLTNARIDSVILEVQDNVLDASGGNLARTRVLTGTPSSGTTLDTRAGAPTLPGNALLLADVRVPANATTVPNSNIRDRRKWARGAFVRIVRTSANYNTASTSLNPIDSTNLNPRVECSGVPTRVSLMGVESNNTAGNGVSLGLNLDGAAIDSTAGIAVGDSVAANTAYSPFYQYPALPTAGSHLFTPTFATRVGGLATLFSVTAIPVVFMVEEVLKPIAQNSNGVTTG